MIVKVSQNLNSMQKFQHKETTNIVVTCFQTFKWVQNIRKQTDSKKLSNTKQMNKAKNIRMKYGNTKLPYVWKYKYVR